MLNVLVLNMKRCLMALLFAVASTSQPQSALADRERILIFTKTAGYRHDSIPAAVAAVHQLAARNALTVEHTEDAAVFSERELARYRAVAFINTTGNVLEDEQKRAFEVFVADGGGYLGVHSAADTAYDWPWYGRLVGAWFKSHPPGLQTGIVRFVRPLRENWPLEWRVTDEFYNFRSRPSATAKIIAVLDESSYEGGEMGADHPIAWCQKIHGGRAWYTGLGHTSELFLDPVFLAHLETGLLFAVRRSEEC